MLDSEKPSDELNMFVKQIKRRFINQNMEPEIDRYEVYKSGIFDQKRAVKEEMQVLEKDADENMWLKNNKNKNTKKLIKQLVGDMKNDAEDHFFQGLLVPEKLQDRYL